MSRISTYYFLATSFGIFLQFNLFERSGLVYTLSQGAVLPIHSNRLLS